MPTDISQYTTSIPNTKTSQSLVPYGSNKYSQKGDTNALASTYLFAREGVDLTNPEARDSYGTFMEYGLPNDLKEAETLALQNRLARIGLTDESGKPLFALSDKRYDRESIRPEIRKFIGDTASTIKRVVNSDHFKSLPPEVRHDYNKSLMGLPGRYEYWDETATRTAGDKPRKKKRMPNGGPPSRSTSPTKGKSRRNTTSPPRSSAGSESGADSDWKDTNTGSLRAKSTNRAGRGTDGSNSNRSRSSAQSGSTHRPKSKNRGSTDDNPKKKSSNEKRSNGPRTKKEKDPGMGTSRTARKRRRKREAMNKKASLTTMTSSPPSTHDISTAMIPYDPGATQSTALVPFDPRVASAMSSHYAGLPAPPELADWIDHRPVRPVRPVRAPLTQYGSELYNSNQVRKIVFDAVTTALEYAKGSGVRSGSTAAYGYNPEDSLYSGYNGYRSMLSPDPRRIELSPAERKAAWREMAKAAIDHVTRSQPFTADSEFVHRGPSGLATTARQYFTPEGPVTEFEYGTRDLSHYADPTYTRGSVHPYEHMRALLRV
jgi:hypothetical protein